MQNVKVQHLPLRINASSITGLRCRKYESEHLDLRGTASCNASSSAVVFVPPVYDDDTAGHLCSCDAALNAQFVRDVVPTTHKHTIGRMYNYCMLDCWYVK